MCADIHDGSEHNTLQSEAGYIDARPHIRARSTKPSCNAEHFSSNFEYGMSGKWLELLKEIAPRVTRVAVLRDPASPAGPC
jgi:hypothetical protein